MRKYFIALTISLAAFITALYLLRTLPPLDQGAVQAIVEAEKIFSEEELLAAIDRLAGLGVLVPYLNWRNLLLILAILAVGVTSTVTLFHMITTKLFYARRGEVVKVNVGVRRGALLSLTLVMLVFLRLYAADWYLYLTTPIFILLLEVLISQATRQPFAESEDDVTAVRKDPTQVYDPLDDPLGHLMPTSWQMPLQPVDANQGEAATIIQHEQSIEPSADEQQS